MRMSRIAAAAGLFVAALGIGSAAEARHHDWRDGRHYGRYDHRPNGHAYGYYSNRGYGYYGNRGYRYGRGYAYRHHPRCWAEWHRGHRVRVCR